MNFKIDKNTATVLIAIAGAVSGGIEARSKLAQMDSTLQAIDRRVERIERELDSARSLAAKDPSE